MFNSPIWSLTVIALAFAIFQFTHAVLQFTLNKPDKVAKQAISSMLILMQIICLVFLLKLSSVHDAGCLTQEEIQYYTEALHTSTANTLHLVDPAYDPNRTLAHSYMEDAIERLLDVNQTCRATKE